MYLGGSLGCQSLEIVQCTTEENLMRSQVNFCSLCGLGQVTSPFLESQQAAVHMFLEQPAHSLQEPEWARRVSFLQILGLCALVAASDGGGVSKRTAGHFVVLLLFQAPPL